MGEEIDSIPISTTERVVLGANSALGAISTTSGVLIEGLIYTTNSVASGGLGIAGAIAAISIVTIAVISLVVAIPIAYYSYKDLISEAEVLNTNILAEKEKRKKQMARLFYELLYFQLLCDLKKSKDKFEDTINDKYICSLFHHLKNKKFKIINCKLYEVTGLEDAMSFSDCIQHPHSQTMILTYLKEHPELNFEKEIANRLVELPVPTEIHHSKAIVYGVTGFFAISGIGLGTSWAFASLIISTGLAASLPMVGWLMLGISFFVLGFMFGLGLGIFKKKNLMREGLCNAYKNENKKLTEKRKDMQDKIRHLEFETALYKMQEEKLSREQSIKKIECFVSEIAETKKQMNENCFHLFNKIEFEVSGRRQEGEVREVLPHRLERSRST